MDIDPNEDRYPELDQVLSQARQHDDWPEGPVERIEITCLASGEATWRVWEPRAEDPLGGYIPAS